MARPGAHDPVAVELFVGGPDVCLVCGRTFTRGGMIQDNLEASAVCVCMWCLAGFLEEITGWAIVDQMRGWLVAREQKRPGRWERYHGTVDAVPDPGPPDSDQ